MKITKWDIIVCAILLMAGFLFGKGCNQAMINDLNHINRALDDSLHFTQDNLGRETASRISFQSSSEFFKRQIRSTDDSILNRLLAEVTKATVSISHLRTATQARESTGEVNTTFPDGDTCNPTFHANFISEWDSIDVTASRKKISFGYMVYNEFKVEQATKSRGLFHAPDVVASVTNLNPHTKTLAMQSFHISYPKRRFGLGPAIGIGFGGSFTPVPIFGIVATYSLIQF